jgi:hypothetical protein
VAAWGSPSRPGLSPWGKRERGEIPQLVRNYLAHGDRLPENYFIEARRPGIGPNVVNFIEVLLEAQSFIIRKSHLKILREDLLDHFADAHAAQDYCTAAWSGGLAFSRLECNLASYTPKAAAML